MTKTLRSGPVWLMATLVICSVFTGTGAEKSPELPSAHLIAGVPWHEQMNGLFCGDGALEILYDYWGPDIEQKPIANVARTSSSGTWTFDMRRAGHFSYMSPAMGRFFPAEVPTAGYPERPLGYAAFSHSSDLPWLAQLKGLIAADVPVIVLTTFEPDGGGGHYRVVVGYNDANSTVYLMDPWGREQKHETGWTGIFPWTYDQFSQSWNYSAEGEGHPHFAAVMIPWKVALESKGKLAPGSTITVTARITYPCPPPFDNSRFPARECSARIILPDGIRLISGSDVLALGEIKAGSTATATWKARIEGNCSGKSIRAEAKGIISGQVPEARWTGETVYYPAYNYTDAIGGEGVLAL
ncbi:MAG: hypothetical protein GKC10_04495 [Methanosarcinales archaeon]|nr:hypothetical protein [Methanosarcinales archaeon]